MLASARPCHQLIRRKDIMPTPSQPIKRRNMLLARISVSIAARKIVRWKKNFVMCGSEAMYVVANCKIDHVTNNAMGKNSIEYWSILKLRGILKFMMNFHSQCEVMLSSPDCIKSVVGIRLIRKAVLMA